MDSTASPLQERSRWRTTLRSIAGWLICGAGPFLIFAMPLSPWLNQHLFTAFLDLRHVQAQMQSCELVRDGRRRENAVKCVFQYEVDGKPHTARIPVWTSESPFDTPAKLAAQLAVESQGSARMLEFDAHDADDVWVPEKRLFAPPALWVYLALAGVLLAALAICVEPGGRTYRRADLRPDPDTGELVEINNHRRNRRRRAAAASLVAISVAALGCLYGISARIANEAAMPALSGMTTTPARLVDCRHRMFGSYKGHDQIDCAFEYRWNGKTMRGQAESLDFRFVPTDSRMDAAVAAVQGKPVTAYVDPARPGYAWAFISNDWFVGYSWGLFELMLVFVLVCVLPIMAGLTIQSLRREN